MSRSLLLIAYAKASGHSPTDAACTDFLAALAEIAGGEYLYVPKLPQSEVDPAEIVRLRSDGMSIRKIARRLGISKSSVGRVLAQPDLSHISPY